MAWSTTEDVAEFLATAGELVSSRPVENTLLLTVAETVRIRGHLAFGEAAPLFGWWRAAGGAVECAFVQTPPYPVLLTPSPEPAVTDLARTLAAAGRQLPGVNAGRPAAEAFAAEWHRRTGADYAVGMRQRLYRLGRLVPPQPGPSGTARTAEASDRELLLAWYEAFGREIGDPAGAAARIVDDRIQYGGLTLWEVAGAPVSMAGVSRPVAGVVRVAPVYTPVELRRRGYAGAVTVAVSEAALRAGAAQVLLFTDLANPTSNALYQRLGFRPVEDRVVLSFRS